MRIDLVNPAHGVWVFSLCSVTRVEEELLKRLGVLFGFEVADLRKKSSRELVKGLLLVSPSAPVLRCSCKPVVC